MYEIKEEDAQGNVALNYSDLRKSLNIKVVNTIWRYLATIDGGLEWVWNSSKKLYKSGKLEKVQSQIIENIQIHDLTPIPDYILNSIGIKKEEKLEILQILNKYNIGNSKNLIGLSSFLKAYDSKIFFSSRAGLLLFFAYCAQKIFLASWTSLLLHHSSILPQISLIFFAADSAEK